MAIISRARHFIFVKTTKTAGTSMEVALARHCSRWDVVTPIIPPISGHRPRHHSFLRKTRFYNHMPAIEIRRKIGQRLFERCYKFCFERHPVDKCISYFAMLKNSPTHQRADAPKDWEEYVERGRFPIDHPKYTDESGRLIVDRIYKYEELQDAWNDICDHLGLPRQVFSVKAKSGFRYGVPSVEEVMARPAQRNKIFDAFSQTMKFVQYP